MAALARHGKALVVEPALQYSTEVRDLFFCMPRPSPFAPGELAEQATSADLVLFVKMGCGFCRAAREGTDGFAARRNIVPLDSVQQRRALASALGLPTVTMPVVFVKGRCIGDSQALQALLSTPGELEARMSMDKEVRCNHTSRRLTTYPYHPCFQMAPIGHFKTLFFFFLSSHYKITALSLI
jgi:glutaredoxin